MGEFIDWKLGFEKHFSRFVALGKHVETKKRQDRKDRSMHVPVIRPFTGLQVLKSRVNLALSGTVSGGRRREEPGDFGGGLTALRYSADKVYPSRAARGPAIGKMSRKFHHEKVASRSRLLTRSAEIASPCWAQPMRRTTMETPLRVRKPCLSASAMPHI